MKTITITALEENALNAIMQKLNKINGRQLRIDDQATEDDALKSFRKNTKAMLTELMDKFGTEWVDAHEKMIRKLQYKHGNTNWNSTLVTLESRGLVEIVYRPANNGDKRFIDKWRFTRKL